MRARKPPPRRLGRPPGTSGDDTRERILVAARVGFGRYGYATTTIKVIGEQAEVTAGAVYRYYDSKLALYVATVRDAIGKLLPRYQEAIAGRKSALAALSGLIEASAELHQSDPSLATFLSTLMTEMRRHEEVMNAVAGEPEMAAITALVTEVVERGQARGEISSEVEAGHVVAMFLACTNGLSLWAATFEDEGSPKMIEAFATLLDGRLTRRRR